jgi:hypothetical protein
MKITFFWDAAQCRAIIALVMEAVSTFETSVNFCETTRRNNPEDSHLPTRHLENLKSHLLVSLHVDVLKFY